MTWILGLGLFIAGTIVGWFVCALCATASRADRDAEHALVEEMLTLRAMRAEALLAEERAQTREAEERIAEALHGEEPR
jgi:hypothetical protein